MPSSTRPQSFPNSWTDRDVTIAMQLETTEEDLMHTVFPHPTLSEMMHESVLDAYGRAIYV
jgi:hypothetical protein